MGQATNAIGDAMGDLTGSNRMAEAAGRAAMAQEQALGRGVGFAQEGLGQAQLTESAMVKRGREAIQEAKSPQELRALTQSLRKQQQAVSKQAELFNSIDPAIMEASQQALSALRGESTAANSALRKRRGQDREKLLARLREQLGPGAETSTAGMQALNQFDSESDMLEQQSIEGLFGMAQQGAQGRSAMNQGTAALAGIGQAFGGRANRLSNTRLSAGQLRLAGGGMEQQGFSNLINAQQGFAAGAGGANVAEQLKGQAQMQTTEQMIDIFGEMSVAGMQSMGSMGGSAGGCFPPGTFILMQDGFKKPIQDIRVGDYIDKGGEVLAVFEAKAGNLTHWYDYQGVTVSGEHAVKEDGKWLRVSDSPIAKPTDSLANRKYNLITASHMMHIDGILFSDFQEVEDHTLSYQESLEVLNETQRG